MKVLLLYPAMLETFWSFKHVLRFVSKRTAFFRRSDDAPTATPT